MIGDTAVGVRVEAVEKRYPNAQRQALSGVSLDIPPGSFFSILGPSGCGKTTLLRILAGFEHPSAGRILIGGADVAGVPPRGRDIAMVFQDYALYPHMTVRQNITFNLKNRRVPTREIEHRLARAASMLGIEQHLGKLPGQLSGGERQRVALGRAVIRQPRVFLMDEPLSNLDLKLRETMRLELGRLHQELGITIVFVTHDQAEAMTLSTLIAVMSNGEVQQVDRPDAIYARPANTFVANFIGSPSMNLFRARSAGGRLVLDASEGVSVPAPAGFSLRDGETVLIGFRPHEMTFAEPGPDRLPVRVSFTEHLGRSNFVVCVPPAGGGYLASSKVIQVETDPATALASGTTAHVALGATAFKLFDGDGRAIHPAAEDGARASAPHSQPDAAVFSYAPRSVA